MILLKLGNFFTLQVGQGADPRELEQLRSGIKFALEQKAKIERLTECDNLGLHIFIDAIDAGYDLPSLKAIRTEIEYAENKGEYEAIRSKYLKGVP